MIYTTRSLLSFFPSFELQTLSTRLIDSVDRLIALLALVLGRHNHFDFCVESIDDWLALMSAVCDYLTLDSVALR